MAAPSIHYRICNEAVSAFLDAVLYESKAAAETAASDLITAHGGPSAIFIYEMVAEVTVATTSTDAAALP